MLPQRKNKVHRIDGVQSILYNPIPEHFGEPKFIDSLKDIFKEYEDMQINTIIPEIKEKYLVARLSHTSSAKTQQMIPVAYLGAEVLIK